jgi:hypothetical protein
MFGKNLSINAPRMIWAIVRSPRATCLSVSRFGDSDPFDSPTVLPSH